MHSANAALLFPTHTCTGISYSKANNHSLKATRAEYTCSEQRPYRCAWTTSLGGIGKCGVLGSIAREGENIVRLGKLGKRPAAFLAVALLLVLILVAAGSAAQMSSSTYNQSIPLTPPAGGGLIIKNETTDRVVVTVSTSGDWAMGADLVESGFS